MITSPLFQPQGITLFLFLAGEILERDEKEEILLEVDHEDHQTHDSSSFTFVLIMDTKLWLLT
jgi:hypothetical protein